MNGMTDPLLALSPQSLAGLMQRQKMQQAVQQNRAAAQPVQGLWGPPQDIRPPAQQQIQGQGTNTWTYPTNGPASDSPLVGGALY